MKFKEFLSLCLVIAAWWTGIESHLAYEEDIDDNFDIVFPERLDKGRMKRDLTTGTKNGHDEQASFKLKAFGKEVVVDIHLNKLVSTSNFTLRYFNEDGELVQQQEAPPNCQYQGHVKGQEAESTVIIDTCHGLSGLIEDEEGQMYIEPYPTKGKGAHKIFKTKDGKLKRFSCGTIPGGNATARERRYSQTTSRSKREAEGEVYKKYLKTTKTRYTELMLIVDNVVYKKYKQDIADVKRRVFTLVNAVDVIYQKINIRVVLSALEIWTDKDHIPFVKKAGEDLRNFENHRLSNQAGVAYDSVHLLRGTMWDDYGGMAYKGEICKKRSLGVDAWNYWGSLGPWLALSHELGHNFNFDHDNIWPSCKCLSPRGCVMGSFKTRVPGFSDCNLHNMTSIDDSCLFNLPKKNVNPEYKCGNGMPEPGEECDCGTPEECKVRDPCCNPNNCRLKKSSQCSDALHTCCQKCQFSPLGTLCRKSSGECDVEEYCTGKSAQCPPDDYIKDGSSCEAEPELLQGKYVEDGKMTKLPQPIIARHVRINPQYWERGLCMKMDLLGCEARTSVSRRTATTIQGFGNLCVKPQGLSSCPSADGTELFYRKPGQCQGASTKFLLSPDGVLRHHCSRKKICPKGGQGGYGVPLVISGNCDKEQSKFERTTRKSLRHVASGFCVHPNGGAASDGVKLILWAGCDEERLAFHFLAQDCLLSLGVADNQSVPDNRISASSSLPGYPANEARLNSARGWCAAKKDKNQFVQIDLGKAKKVSAILQRGTDTGDVTAFSLQYSLDGQRWTVWSSKPRTSLVCYRGKCVPSADTQCRDLWGPEASNAPSACYEKLNGDAQGFGSCSPMTNLPCRGRENAKCGQLQCYSATRTRPVVDYGSYYELKVLPTGEKCSAASRKGGTGNELVGMVKDGTVCGVNKICVANRCTSVDQLVSKQCPKASNGLECSGKGVCTSKGKCKCRGNLDPETVCQTGKTRTTYGFSNGHRIN
ncbi:disintegrin and metalloproteinase domain-containing protein 8-like isoform X2 [Orbicella faveolata]|uniref:disintegrin and metalloproteinase domain-containing protein 8-like isoform X2 n=1 Tax=Orbicella faveolata TaxID=48498 RepID=UPI0009E37B7A|nr:disintegrin and metalloproteinase domain-containing protein 8-like isoform X2 [Orbicella faveolata]